jgi:hypothetical protein
MCVSYITGVQLVSKGKVKGKGKGKGKFHPRTGHENPEE